MGNAERETPSIRRPLDHEIDSEAVRVDVGSAENCSLLPSLRIGNHKTV
jgi:hypothetical protein